MRLKGFIEFYEVKNMETKNDVSKKEEQAKKKDKNKDESDDESQKEKNDNNNNNNDIQNPHLPKELNPKLTKFPDIFSIIPEKLLLNSDNKLSSKFIL